MPQRPAKVTRPHPSDLVPRDKTLAILTDHGARALWLWGPPGAGKTALANLWLDALGTPSDACAWLQVDSTDHDPAGTFHYLALATPGGAEGLPKADAEQLTALETFARTFFRAWFSRFPESGVVVLDDCHAADHLPGFATILSVLVDSMPEHVRLLCLSRAEPPNALARAVAYRTLGVIGPDALLLPTEDALALARARGLTDADRAAVLLQRSEGWLAGFTLMVENAVHGVEAPAFGTDPDRETLFGFFLTEILSSVPAALRGGLARMAVMPDITLEEAAVLGGGPAAADLLGRLHERRLFIDRRPLTTSDGNRVEVFRFHALLAGCLDEVLVRDLPASAIAALRVHGAHLLEARGSIEDSFTLVCRAQAWDEATRIVLTHAEALLGQGRWETVTGWIMAIPETEREAEPWLLYWWGVALIAIQPTSARGVLERAFHRFLAIGNRDGQALAAAGVMWSHNYEGFSTHVMDEWFGHLERLLTGDEGFASPTTALVTWAGFLAGAIWVRPDHALIETAKARVIDMISDPAIDPNRRAGAGISVVHYLTLTGRFEEGWAVQMTLDTLQSSGLLSPVNRCHWLAIRGLRHYFLGDSVTALIDLQASRRLGEEVGLPMAELISMPFEAWQHLMIGQSDEAATIIELVRHRVQHEWAYLMSAYQISASMLHSQRGAWPIARQHAIEAMEAVRRTNSRLTVTIWAGISAAAHADADDFAGAQALVEEGRAARAGTHYTCYDAVFVFAEAWTAWRQGDREGARVKLRECLERVLQRPVEGNFIRWHQRAAPVLLAEALRSDIHASVASELIQRWRFRPPLDAPDRWPWRVRIRVFGPLSVEVDNAPLPAGRKTPRRLLDLLGLLVLAGSHGMSVAALGDSLYPEQDGDAAAGAVRQGIHRLRLWLRNPEAVTISIAGSVHLDPMLVWTDHAALLRRSQGREDDPVAQARYLLDLHTGPLLPSCEHLPVVLAERSRIAQRIVQRAREAGDGLAERGAHQEAADLWTRALEVDPVAEPLWQRLIQAHARRADGAEAAAALRRCNDALREHLGKAPSAETLAIAKAMGVVQ